MKTNLRNTGNYPLRITKIFSRTNNGFVDSVFWYGGPGGDREVALADHYYLSPGEEKSFISAPHSGCRAGIYFVVVKDAPNSFDFYLGGAQTTCRNTSDDGRNFGNLYIKEFGFEYVEYINGQNITKMQMGKPLVIKCTGPTYTPPSGWPNC